MLTTKTGKYRIFPIIGGLVMAVGMFLLSRIGVTTSRWQTVFLWVTPASVLIFLLAFLIKEVPLRGRATSGEEVPAPEAEALIG